MWQKIKIVLTLGMIIGLCACMPTHHQGSVGHPTYNWQGQAIYPESYEGNYGYRDYPQEKKQVVVPETYHVGSYHSPARAKDRDQNWVSNQNSSGYTIELANGSKASQVAGKLHRAPKSNRRAQVKYQQNGQIYYKGVYGSYSNYQEAKQALDTLPDDVRNGAKIQSWGNVQSNINRY